MRTARAAAGLALAGLVWTAPAGAQRFDPAPAWPLCGRISAAPPLDWDESDGCPPERWGTAAHADFPLSDTYGPRIQTSLGDVYDYHRGLDIPTPAGTPVFAVAEGLVTLSADDTVQIRHLRPGESACTPTGCWFSRSIHLADRTVAPGETVAKGTLIGHTGASESGFEHLHFEIRDAPGFDPLSAWQRDAIHPLALLPYADLGSAATTVSVVAVDTSQASHPVPEIEVVLAGIGEVDLARLEIDVYERFGDASYRAVIQASELPDADGYLVAPPWVDFAQRNFLYTHKDSTSFPWESFADCPYAADHPATYDPLLHLDRRLAGDSSVGEFDGARIAPVDWNASSAEVRYRVAFDALVGPASAEATCVVATAFDVHGADRAASWQCGALLYADGFESEDLRRWSAAST